VSVLLTSLAAVRAGARPLAAIGEWAADAPPAVLAGLGVRFDPLAGRVPAAGRGHDPPGPGGRQRRPR
jgi:hypothetical protein